MFLIRDSSDPTGLAVLYEAKAKKRWIAPTRGWHTFRHLLQRKRRHEKRITILCIIAPALNWLLKIPVPLYMDGQGNMERKAQNAYYPGALSNRMR